MKTALVLVLMLVVSTYYAEAMWCYCWNNSPLDSQSHNIMGGTTQHCCFEGDVRGVITRNYCEVGPASRGWGKKFENCCKRLADKAYCT